MLVEKASPGIYRVVSSPDPRTKGSHFSLSASTQGVCARPAKRDRFSLPWPPRRVGLQAPARRSPRPAGHPCPSLFLVPRRHSHRPPPGVAPFAPGARPRGEGAGPRASLPVAASPRLPRGSPSGGRRCGASLQSPGARCAQPPPSSPPPRRRRVPPALLAGRVGGGGGGGGVLCERARGGRPRGGSRCHRGGRATRASGSAGPHLPALPGREQRRAAEAGGAR